MRPALIIFFNVMMQLLLASTTPHQYQYQTKISCETTKNLTVTCLNEEITLLHSAAAGIHGNIDNRCDPLVSEQTCQLCRLFNRTKVCLNILLDTCDYSEIHQFLWSHKVPYLGTISSLCHQDNLLDEIYENLECYNGITVNLRKCFNALETKNRSCSAVNNGYRCANMISEAYCAQLFKEKLHHKDLSSLYLRTLEPVIDLQNCTGDSELYVAEVYPEYQYLWKKQTTPSLVVELDVNTATSAVMAAAVAEQSYNSGVDLTLSPGVLLLLICSLTKQVHQYVDS